MMRIMDVVLGFPSLILAIAIVFVLGPGLRNTLLAIAIVTIPPIRTGDEGIGCSRSKRSTTCPHLKPWAPPDGKCSSPGWSPMR